MNSEQIVALSPYLLDREHLVNKEVIDTFKKSFGNVDLKLLEKDEYLRYEKFKLETVVFPSYVKDINMHSIHDPHLLITILRKVQSTVILLEDEVLELSNYLEITEHLKQTLKSAQNAHKISAKINKHFQQCISKKQFSELIETIQELRKEELVCSIASDAIMTLTKIASNNNSPEKLQDDLLLRCRMLMNLTDEYHPITIEKIPRLQLLVDLHKGSLML